MAESQTTDREKFEQTILNTLKVGGFSSLLDGERKRGYASIFPGEVDWLSRADWPSDVVISLDGKTVRIVAIHARRPGTGAFRRLIEAIIKAGLSPVVIEPLIAMPEILSRWGWSSRVIGNDFESREEQWYPCALLRRVA